MAKLGWLQWAAEALRHRRAPIDTEPAHRSTPISTDLQRVLKGPLSPPCDPDIAARRLVNWMQANGFVGDYGWRPLPDDPKRGGILQFYDWYCSDERTTPLPPKVFAEALGKIVPRRKVRFGARRLTVYHIPDAIDRTWIKNEADHDARTSH